KAIGLNSDLGFPGQLHQRINGRPMAGRRLCLSLLLRRLLHGRPATVDARFDLVAEMADQALDGPSGGVAQGADGVPFDPGRDVPKKVDLPLFSVPTLHALQHAPHPAGALAAGSALAAALVLV